MVQRWIENKGQGEENSKLPMPALMWISHPERPLKSNELCHALAVEIESPNLNRQCPFNRNTAILLPNTCFFS